MKLFLKRIVKPLVFIVVFCIAIVFFLNYTYKRLYPTPKSTLAWAKDYNPDDENLRGHYDTSDFDNKPAYKYGMNRDGYLVFKDPDAALAKVKEDCADVIEMIKTSYRIGPLNNFNFQLYGVYGSKLEDIEGKTLEQLNMLLNFIEIYSNSF